MKVKVFSIHIEINEDARKHYIYILNYKASTNMQKSLK